MFVCIYHEHDGITRLPLFPQLGTEFLLKGCHWAAVFMALQAEDLPLFLVH